MSIFWEKWHKVHWCLGRLGFWPDRSQWLFLTIYIIVLNFELFFSAVKNIRLSYNRHLNSKSGFLKFIISDKLRPPIGVSLPRGIRKSMGGFSTNARIDWLGWLVDNCDASVCCFRFSHARAAAVTVYRLLGSAENLLQHGAYGSTFRAFQKSVFQIIILKTALWNYMKT